MQGTVKWFNNSKGFGFLTTEEGRDFFFHHTDIKMDGFRSLDSEDIVDFEIGADKDGREKAVNVQPVITKKMVVHELAKEEHHIMRIGDDKGVHDWYVVDKEDKPVIDKEMDLIQLAAYAGFDVEGSEVNDNTGN